MTNKRFQQNPPVELFNKLSLASEPQQNTLHRPTLPPRPTKILKENMNDSLQQALTIKPQGTEKLQGVRAQQTHYGSGVMTEISSQVNSCRTLGIH